MSAKIYQAQSRITGVVNCDEDRRTHQTTNKIKTIQIKSNLDMRYEPKAGQLNLQKKKNANETSSIVVSSM